MSVEKLREKLLLAKSIGRLPKVVIPVHFAGQSCEMYEIKSLADEYGFKIIEDASHAIGGKYRGEPVGNCKYSDICVFSFHPVKIITTGEGGMALTNDKELDARLRLFRSHGITRSEHEMEGAAEGPWYYQQIELGYNYRMTDIQAALGISQMKRLGEFCGRRRDIASHYEAVLPAEKLVLPWQHPDTESAYHLYPIMLARPGVDNRGKIFELLRGAGIGVNVHYIPVHLQPYYRRLGFNPGDFPEAENYYSRAISLPVFATMTEAQQTHIVESIERLVP